MKNLLKYYKTFHINYLNIYTLNLKKILYKESLNSFFFCNKETYKSNTINNSIKSNLISDDINKSSEVKKNSDIKNKINDDNDSYIKLVNFYDIEFNKIYEQNKKEKLEVLERELSEDVRKELEMLADEVCNFKLLDEKILFNIYYKEIFKESTNIDITKTRHNWMYYSNNTKNFWPPENANWGRHEFDPYGGSSSKKGRRIKGISPNNNIANKNKDAKENKNVEEKTQDTPKQIYDIKLTSFDATKKISVIKEVRALLNLGLKEAKELVEQTPVVLVKGGKLDEAENIKNKLKDVCVIEIV